MIHIVVRHPGDVQRWKNEWMDKTGPRMLWITTDAKVAGHCQEAFGSKARVRFHRCGFPPSPPVVCCEASVKVVQKVDRDFYIVHFQDQEALDLEPLYKPHQNENSYRAGPKTV